MKFYERRIDSVLLGLDSRGAPGNLCLSMTDDLPPSALARRLLRLLNATKVIPWEADARTWQFTYVGPQAEALLGYPIEQWYEDGFWAELLFQMG